MKEEEMKQVPKQESSSVIKQITRSPGQKKKKMYSTPNISVIRSQGHMANVDLHNFEMIYSELKLGKLQGSDTKQHNFCSNQDN